MKNLIDGSNMLHRALWEPAGKVGIHPLREVYIRFLAPSEETIIVWDGYNANKRRRDLFPGYKIREEKSEDIKASFDIIKEVFMYCPVTQIEIPTWEADDVLYTLAKTYDEEIRIETNDQDFWQLANRPNISLPLVKPLPCLPENTPLYKALCGDQSDRIPGWRGFGPKRFEAMSDHYNTMYRALAKTDWETWQSLPWPKGITLDEVSFFQCCIFLEVVTMLDVPYEEFEGNIAVGRSHPAMVEEIFGRWRI